MSSPRVSTWLLSRLWPLASGEVLHRAALVAGHDGDSRLAGQLYHRAALAYRRELRLLPLARLRVHELITRWHASDGNAELGPEIERRLSLIDDIESPAPPHEVVPAGALRMSWREGVAPPASAHAA